MFKRKPAPAGEKVFVSWSGGKDAYLSLLLAREKGLNVVCLLNFTGEDGYSRSHGLPAAVPARQAATLGLSLETEKVTWQSYEDGFARAVERLKKRGVTGGVFGDVNLAEHREWIEKMCRRCGISYHLPLWGMAEREVSEELLRRGGRAVLVALRNDLLPESLLGKELDRPFLDYCEKKGLSPCGERGEFHTLVVDGSCFNRPLYYRFGKVERAGCHSRLKIH